LRKFKENVDVVFELVDPVDIMFYWNL
jgi:hypothetical protein